MGDEGEGEDFHCGGLSRSHSALTPGHPVLPLPPPAPQGLRGGLQSQPSRGKSTLPHPLLTGTPKSAGVLGSQRVRTT